MSDFLNPIPAPAFGTPAKMPVQKITYHGDVGDIIGLHVINLLLSICTIGIYSFWGKTRIRRYITSHLALAKDRFEYTGTGMELFLGWLKALLIFVPIIILMEIPGVNLLVLPFFLGVIAAAVYLAMRYRLSRTRWRGIRFSLGGSVWQYLWLGLKRGLVNILTLGILIPRSDIVMWTYLANHMQFGEARFKYAGDAKRLTKVHLVSLGLAIFLPIFTMIAVGAGVGISKIGDILDKAEIHREQTQQVSAPEDVVPQAGQSTNNISGQHSYDDSAAAEKSYTPTPEEKQKTSQEALKKVEEITSIILPLIFTFYGAIFIGVAARLWYHAALWQEKFRGLQLEKLRFKLEVSGKEMAKMYGLNLLIIIFTMGLGKPITTHLWIKFFTERLKIGGDTEKLIVDQNKTGIGSGMGDALAADVGFDMGL